SKVLDVLHHLVFERDPSGFFEDLYLFSPYQHAALARAEHPGWTQLPMLPIHRAKRRLRIALKENKGRSPVMSPTCGTVTLKSAGTRWISSQPARIIEPRFEECLYGCCHVGPAG